MTTYVFDYNVNGYIKDSFPEPKKLGKIYISGKMTGLDNYKEPFDKVEKWLKKQKYKVFNPDTLSDKIISKHHMTLNEAFLPTNRALFLREDIQQLLKCDTIYMLPNYFTSEGANLELSIAKGLRYNIIIGDLTDFND